MWGEKDIDGLPYDGTIHTCNNTLLKTKKEARAETVRILKTTRKRLVERSSSDNQNIRYIDYVLARKGRHP
jgi:hypothetical protein